MQRVDRPHILFVSFDSVRQDWIGCYGSTEGATPCLDRLAETGTVFTNSVANAGWTLPQHTSFFTGEYPLSHGMIAPAGNRRLSLEKKVLAEYLQGAGYLTFEVSNGNPYAGGGFFGLNRGLTDYTHVPQFALNMEKSADVAISYFDEYCSQSSCYVYVHSNDVHEQCSPPETFMQTHGERFLCQAEDPEDEYKRALVHADYHFGRILNALDDLGIRENTVVVAVTDHGRDYGERGSRDKRLNLYNEVTDTALIASYPREWSQGAMVESFVEAIDIAPTILDVAGVSGSDNIHGTSLIPWIRGEAEEPRSTIVFSHTFMNWEVPGEKDPEYVHRSVFDHLAARTTTHKYIRTVILTDHETLTWPAPFQWLAEHVGLDYSTFGRGTVVTELYDLVADPGEQHPIGHELPEIESDLSKKVNEWTDATQSRLTSLVRTGRVKPTRDAALLEERLRALGYLD